MLGKALRSRIAAEGCRGKLQAQPAGRAGPLQASTGSPAPTMPSPLLFVSRPVSPSTCASMSASPARCLFPLNPSTFTLAPHFTVLVHILDLLLPVLAPKSPNPQGKGRGSSPPTNTGCQSWALLGRKLLGTGGWGMSQIQEWKEAKKEK